MTEQLGALACLLDIRRPAELSDFYAQWGHDRLVIDKWFALQIHAAPAPHRPNHRRADTAQVFDWKNPNPSALSWGAQGNAAGFHDPSGASYRLPIGLIQLDPVNPMTAARMTTAFEAVAAF
jgi:aminopeptidase N